jgi:WD40 repeat protein
MLSRQDATLKLWDPASGQLLRTLEGHAKLIRAVAFSRDGARVLSGSWDKTLKLWDVATGQLVRTFEGHADGVESVTFSPDGALLL